MWNITRFVWIHLLIAMKKYNIMGEAEDKKKNREKDELVFNNKL